LKKLNFEQKNCETNYSKYKFNIATGIQLSISSVEIVLVRVLELEVSTIFFAGRKTFVNFALLWITVKVQILARFKL